MDSIVLIIILSIVIFFAYKFKKARVKAEPKQKPNKSTQRKDKIVQPIKSYRPRYLLSLNEKSQYNYLKPITDKLNLTLFIKIRLADIIEPANKKDYSAFNKIKSKHVDFVVCSSNLKIVTVIEIDDNSHKKSNRIDRDSFVDTILNNCGINIIHSYNLTTSNIEEQLITLTTSKITSP